MRFKTQLKNVSVFTSKHPTATTKEFADHNRILCVVGVS